MTLQLFKWLFDVRWRVIWSRSRLSVIGSWFEVMFVPEEEIQQVTIVGMRESIGGDFFQVGGGVTLNIIIMWGGVEINFCLMRGGVWLSFGAYFTHFPTPHPGNYCTVPNCNKFNKSMLLSKISREFKNTGIFGPSNDTSRPSKDPYLWRQLLDKKFTSATPSHSIVSSCHLANASCQLVISSSHLVVS